MYPAWENKALHLGTRWSKAACKGSGGRVASGFLSTYSDSDRVLRFYLPWFTHPPTRLATVSTFQMKKLRYRELSSWHTLTDLPRHGGQRTLLEITVTPSHRHVSPTHPWPVESSLTACPTAVRSPASSLSFRAGLVSYAHATGFASQTMLRQNDV